MAPTRPDPSRRPAAGNGRRPTLGVPRRTATIGAAAALATGALTGWFAATTDAGASTTSTDDGRSTVDSSSSDIPQDDGPVFGGSSSSSGSFTPDTRSGTS
jgi:hypothetical protein